MHYISVFDFLIRPYENRQEEKALLENNEKIVAVNTVPCLKSDVLISK